MTKNERILRQNERILRQKNNVMIMMSRMSFSDQRKTRASTQSDRKITSNSCSQT